MSSLYKKDRTVPDIIKRYAAEKRGETPKKEEEEKPSQRKEENIMNKGTSKQVPDVIKRYAAQKRQATTATPSNKTDTKDTGTKVSRNAAMSGATAGMSVGKGVFPSIHTSSYEEVDKEATRRYEAIAPLETALKEKESAAQTALENWERIKSGDYSEQKIQEAYNAASAAIEDYNTALSQHTNAVNFYNSYVTELQPAFEDALNLEELETMYRQLSAEAAALESATISYQFGHQYDDTELSAKEAEAKAKRAEVEEVAKKIAAAKKVKPYALAQKYSSYFDASDFEEYAAKGAAIENPSYHDAMKYGSYFGWAPGADKIGNVVTFSIDNADSVKINTTNGVGHARYTYLTDEEVRLYNYLLAKEGEESAQAFLDYMEDTLNARQGVEEAKSVRDIENPIARAIATGLHGLYTGGQTYAHNTKQFFSEDELAAPAAQYGFQYIYEDLGNPDGEGKTFAQHAYSAANTVGNMLPSIIISTAMPAAGVSSGVAQTIGVAAMGVSAAGGAYKQALSEGYTKGRARTYSTLVGTSEAVLQRLIGGIGALGGISDDLLLAKVGAIDSALARIALTGAIKIGSEEIEEYAQLWLEPAFRAIIFNEDYNAPTSEEQIETIIVTALSTGFLETPGIISAGHSDYASIGKEIKSYGDLFVKAVIDAGLASDPSTQSYKQAAKLQERLDAGDTISDHELGLLYQTNVETTGTEQQPADPLEEAAIEAVANEQKEAESSQEPVEVTPIETPAETAKTPQNATSEALSAAATASVANTVLNSTETTKETVTTKYGEYGKRALNAVMRYDNISEAEAKNKIDTAYKAGLTGIPLKSVKFETSTQEMAFEAGRADAAMNAKTVPLENVGKTEYTVSNNIDGTEALNNGTAEEIRLRDGGEWDGSSYTAGTIPAVESGSRRNQIRQTTGRPADSETASLTLGKRVSTSSLGIVGGSTKSTIRLVTGGETTAVRQAKQVARERGLRLVLFAGDNLSIRQKGADGVVHDISARAFISGDRVFVRADHPDFTSEQLIRHEAGHDMIAKGEINPQDVRDRIDREFGKEKAGQVVDAYAEGYEGSGMTAEEIWEELICDSLADMNVFAGTKVEGAEATLQPAVKKTSTEAKTEAARETKEDTNDRSRTRGNGFVAPEGTQNASRNGPIQRASSEIVRGGTVRPGILLNDDPAFGEAPKSQWTSNSVIAPQKGSVAYEEQQNAMEYGVPSFVISDVVWESQGKKEPAFTYDGQIYFRETLPGECRGMLAIHELTHMMKQEKFAPYLRFVNRVPDMMNLDSDEAQILFAHIAKKRGVPVFGEDGTLDIEKLKALEKGSKDFVKLYDELNATLYGHIKANKLAGLREGLEVAFRNFDAYCKELHTLHKQYKESRTRVTGKASHELDTDYMKAVENDDMETAQKMVDEAAKAAGYNSPLLYHGTKDFGFTQIDPARGDDGISFFATSSLDIARTYSNADEMREIAEDGRIAALDVYGLPEFDAAYDLLSNMAEDEDITDELWDCVEAIVRKVNGQVFGYEMFDYMDAYDKVRAISEVAYMYGGSSGIAQLETYMDRINEAIEEMVGSDPGNYGLYGNTDGFLVLDARRRSWNDIPLGSITTDFNDWWVNVEGFAPSIAGAYREGNTRTIAKYAKAKGYSGVTITNVWDDGGRSTYGQIEPGDIYIFFNPQEQVKSADPVTYDDNGNVIPLSERFNEERDDIRFSREIDNIEQLRKENERLKEVNTELKKQLKTTTFVTIDKKSLDAFAKKILKDYGSGADINEVRDNLDTLYGYLMNGEKSGEGPTWETAYRMAYDISRNIIENSYELDDALYEEYKEIRNYLRSTGITLNPEYGHDLRGYESLNEFRKKNFGRIKMVKNGLPVDTAYKELASMYPGYFDESEYSHPADQLSHMAEVLDQLQPTMVNPHSAYYTESVNWLANDIMERFFELPQAKSTFADKAQQKLTKQVIKDAKKLEKLRAEKNERIAQVIKRERDRANKIRKQERDKRSKAVKQVKDYYLSKQAAGSERRNSATLRKRIAKHANELSKKLLHPTDKQHVPQKMRDAVAAVLEAINLESSFEWAYGKDGMYHKVKPGTVLGAEATKRTEAFRKLKEAYAEVLSQEGGEMVIDPSLLGDAAQGFEGYFDQVLKMGDKRLTDMSVKELELVWRVLKAVERSVTTAGKMLASEKFESAAEWAEAFEKDTDTRRRLKGSKIEAFRLDLENPYTFFAHYGKAGNAVFRMLRDAQDAQQHMVETVNEEVRKIVDPKQVKAWEKEVHEFKTERGEKLVLTTAHMMEIHELMKREQARDHLTKGGIVQPEIKSKKINRGTDAVLLSLEDIMKITGKLTQEQIAVADKLQALTTGLLAQYGNEASTRAYGYEKFTGNDYWPIKSAREGVHSNIEKGGNNSRSIKNIGLAKSVIPHASNPLDIGGIFNTFASHAADMTDYAAWLCPMEDANRLYNFKFRDEMGQQSGVTMKGLLDRYGGKNAQKYWHNLMEDIQNGIAATNDTAVMNVINKTIGNARAASVGANVRVVIQQPTAIIRAAMVLNPADMAKGLVKGVTKGNGWKKALKYADIAKRKDMGGFDISSPAQMNEILFDSKTNLQKFNDAMMWGAGKADAVTWGKIWNACEWAVKKNSKLKVGGEEFYDKTAELFTEVVDQSQVVDGVLQRSQMMRSSNALVKQATAFMGEPTMAMNMMLRAYDGLRNEQDTKKRGAAIKKFGRAATVLLVTNVVNAFAQSLIDAIRDDDDEKKYWERVLAAFTGLSGEEETLWEKASGVVLSSNAGEGLNPVSYVPFAKDILSILQGYNVTRADADVMADVISAYQTFIDSMWGDGKKTKANAILNLAKQVSKVFGISAGNITRDVYGLLRSIAAETDNVAVQYELEKWIYKVDNKSNRSRFVDILYRAYQTDKDTFDHIYKEMIEGDFFRSVNDKGEVTTTADYIASSLKGDMVKDLYKLYKTNPTAYKAMYNDLIKRDFLKTGVKTNNPETDTFVSTEDAISKAMETLMKKDQGVNKVSDLEQRYLSPDDQRRYDGIMSSVQKSDLWSDATEKQRDNFEDDVYTYLTSDSKTTMEMIEDMDAAKKYGVDETEYLLWNLALEMHDKPSESGDYGSYNTSEKADAITAMGSLSNKEKAYLWSTKTTSDEVWEAYDAGVDIDDYVKFKAGVSELESGVDYKKGNTDSRKAAIRALLRSLDLDDHEYSWLYHTEYKK